ncbi:MAG: hypothetical protein IT168_07740 [Bryobacterales bacterium]|nr:hypothetical protein [Bryobacterales bacterium]
MRTEWEIPDALLREAESAAAQKGISLPQFVSETLAEKLGFHHASEERPWMRSFGKLRDLREETARINALIEEAFEQIDPEDWD